MPCISVCQNEPKMFKYYFQCKKIIFIYTVCVSIYLSIYDCIYASFFVWFFVSFFQWFTLRDVLNVSCTTEATLLKLNTQTIYFCSCLLNINHTFPLSKPLCRVAWLLVSMCLANRTSSFLWVLICVFVRCALLCPFPHPFKDIKQY